MEINNQIREQVLSDLEAAFSKTSLPIVESFNGLPTDLIVSDVPDENEVPALSVSLSDGNCVDESLDDETWQALLTCRIHLKARSNKTMHKELDEYGEVIKKAFADNYTAGNLLERMNRTAYEYLSHETSPLCMIDIVYTVEYIED